MPVTWNWKEKMGVITVKQKDLRYPTIVKSLKLNIYSANCLAALIYNFKDPKTNEDMYQFYTFFCDLDHLKRCLGLKPTFVYDYDLNKSVKKLDNLFKKEDSYWDKVKINIYYPDMLKMADCLARAGIKTEVYYKEPKKSKRKGGN